MGLRYFKRFRMEIDLTQQPLTEPVLPEGYCWSAWDESLVERHASAKFASFQGEIDAKVFPCLGKSVGCRHLMREIASRDTFLPAATWLISQRLPDGSIGCDCGTIQGLAQQGDLGSVQNVGVVPEYRGLGLGRALVLKALGGFLNVNLRRVYLEVTAENTSAVQLYRSLGFRLARTLYKAVPAEPSSVKN